MITIETEFGTITITKPVIGKLIADVIDEFEGKVILSNHKGKVSKFVPKIGGMDEINNMEITFTEKGLDVRVFVVLRFGTSIARVTNHLADEIRRQIQDMTGMKLNSAAVVVTGMISKHIAPRHIEVTR